jgi:two-component system sensor histidine kinase KdpD
VLKEKQSVHVPVVGAGLALFDRSGCPLQVHSLAAFPLTATGGTAGLLVLHSPVPAAIGPAVVAAVEDMAAPLGLLAANARLRQVVSAMQSAQEDARLREELLAALSHDMQTPLAVLLGSVRALQQFDDLAPKHRAGLYEGMARRGAQLQRLVEQFLDYSRLEAGRPIEARPSSTDVGAAIARLETDLGWRRPLELAVPPDLPPAFVDPDRLNQVLGNLISNALKFSPVGSPISVTARADDDEVQVVVEDRGRGMSPAELEKAFLKFHRGSGSADTPGTGLGLYVSRAVIEAQGGRLSGESQPGRGSRFTLALPRREPGALKPEDGSPPE